MKTLVINTGSSSIKYQLFDMPEGKVISSGLIEQIGEDHGHVQQREGAGQVREVLELRDELIHSDSPRGHAPGAGAAARAFLSVYLYNISLHKCTLFLDFTTVL